MDWQIFLLGLIQGIGEIFPISSSAHLRIAESFLLPSVSPTFLLALNAFLHVGSLLALLLFFRKSLVLWVIHTLLWVKNPARSPLMGAREFFHVLVASVPTALIGLGMKLGGISSLPLDTLSVLLGMNGVLLLSLAGLGGGQRRMFWLPALILGVAQGFLTLPGLSRSGGMFFVALMLGFSRKDSLRYAFLLGIPGILGASLLSLPDLIQGLPELNLSWFSLGLTLFLTFFTSFQALIFLNDVFAPKMIQKNGVWCLMVASFALMFGLKGMG